MSPPAPAARNTYRLVEPLITFIELLCRSRSYLSIGPITANQSRTQRTVGLRQTSADEISQSTAGQWASMIRSCLAGFCINWSVPCLFSSFFLFSLFFFLFCFHVCTPFWFREPLSFSSLSSSFFLFAPRSTGTVNISYYDSTGVERENDRRARV